MRENKGTYQDKGTFASCKGSAAWQNSFVYGCNRLQFTTCFRSLATFPAPTDNFALLLSLYYVCLCHLLQIYSNISTMEKPLSADTMGIYISAVTGCK